MPERIGRYEILREIGRGAMGVVYEGRDPLIGRRVAVKTVRQDVALASGLGEEMLQRFIREAQAAGGVSHPNIITIYEAAQLDDVAYIAMECLDGGDLRRVMQARRDYEIPRLVEICAVVCDALDAAHAQGIIHRDIKPANILFSREGFVKVADFGIARVTDSSLTQDGALVGTPHYMSPEQFMGQPLDGRSDLFSVAILLYELLTGEKPFSGEALSTVMHHVLKSKPALPSELNFAVPDALDRVMMKALAKRPQDRYANGRELAAALRESLKAEPDSNVLLAGELRKADTLVRASAPSLAEVEATGAAEAQEATAGAEAIAEHDATHTQQRPAAEAAAVPPQRTEAPAQLPVPTAKPLGRIALVALALVLALGGLSFYFSQRGPENAPSPGPTPSLAAPVAPAERATESIFIDIWGAETLEAFAAISDAVNKDEFERIRREQGLMEAIKPVRAAVTITAPSDPAIRVETRVSEIGGPVDIPAGAPSYQIRVTAAGYASEAPEVLRGADGKLRPVSICLLKE